MEKKSDPVNRSFLNSFASMSLKKDSFKQENPADYEEQK